MPPSKTERQRAQLFDQYAANLELLAQTSTILMVPELRGSILCPLCFSHFVRSQLDQPQILTLDHVPPKSLGGRDSDVVLLCGQCNHTLGSAIDAHLLRTLRAANVANGVPGSQVDARLYPDDSASSYISVTFGQSEGGALTVHVSRERSNPATADQLFARLLRIGYLLLFKQFGYGALVHPAMNDIRRHIQCPQEQVLPRAWSLPRLFANGLPAGISVINEPEALRSFVVVFDLNLDGHISRHAVILPVANPPGLSVYHILEAGAVPTDDNILNGTHIPADPIFWTIPPQSIIGLYLD